MKDIPLNAEVICKDGKCGKTSHVIINPLNRDITHVVVQNEEFVGSHKRLVPLAQIIASNHKSIHLNCTKDELAEMEKFTETHYYIDRDVGYPSLELPAKQMLDELDPFLVMWPYVYTDDNPYLIPEEDELIPTGEMAVRRGAEVKATDGYVGKVNEFVIDAQNNCITHLVLREGHLWDKKELTLPLSAIASMEEGIVHLNLDKKTAKSLPAIPIRRFYS
ncbi:PRC-barrel domain containing protein [Pleurocapsales cyanobacterium LEGE 10410]|nr:PRC-barrel domain containing protein [Pleurocapsales cyanobacterium LEGE 10410]